MAEENFGLRPVHQQCPRRQNLLVFRQLQYIYRWIREDWEDFESISRFAFSECEVVQIYQHKVRGECRESCYIHQGTVDTSTTEFLRLYETEFERTCWR
jgi:hypothetical protein